ncbi:Fungal specific transcription factor domain-containing protein [Cladophialophora immunda]|nr:Fungal specific transcription factor domain-containing protein [Cladophialophora immunda]
MQSFTCTKNEHELFHFLHNTVSKIICDHGPAAPLCYLLQAAHQFIHDEAVMQLIISFSSYIYSSFLGGDEHHERNGLRHFVEGMAVVIQKLGQPQSSTSESTIQAVMLMSAIEALAGNMEGVKTHISAARLMVKMRGGLETLCPLLLWQICSAEPRIFETTGLETFPCTDRHFGLFLLNYRPDVGMEHTTLSGTSPFDKQPVDDVLEFCDPLDLPPNLYLSACVTELLLVTRQFRELSEARNQLREDQESQRPSPYPSAWCFSVSNAVRSPHFSILNPESMQLGPCSVNNNEKAKSSQKHDTTRLVCLFYIHATLWRYRHEPTETDSWVLVWLCLSDENLKTDDKEIGWRGLTRLVSRLTRVAGRLGKQSRRNLELAMFEGLVGQQQLSAVGQGERGKSAEHPNRTTGGWRWPEPEEVWKEFIA